MRLFISYAREDQPQVQTLVNILRDGGHDPWFDHRLLPGQDWQEELLRAIRRSDAFVYVLTPDSVASEWCQWEFARAIELGKPIVPVLLKKGTELPETLAPYQYADLSEGLTPRTTARLMGGLSRIAITIPPENAPRVRAKPGGTPARAEVTPASTRRLFIIGAVVAILAVAAIIGGMIVTSTAVTPTPDFNLTPGTPDLGPAAGWLEVQQPVALYSGPGTQYVIITTVDSGPLAITGSSHTADGLFYQVQLGELAGWVQDTPDVVVAEITEDIPDVLTPTPSPTMLQVRYTASVRAGPGRDYPAITYINDGILPVTGTAIAADGTYYHVQLGTMDGWVQRTASVALIGSEESLPELPTPTPAPYRLEIVHTAAIRAAPGRDQPIITFVTEGTLPITGLSRTATGTFYRVLFGGIQAWVQRTASIEVVVE